MKTTQMKSLQELVGKPIVIESIDESAVNCLTIKIKDGQTIMLEAENIQPSIGLIGIVPYKVTN